jgi:hypothetical protein
MSYACIDQEELNRRGLCDGVACAPPSIVRETIFEPIMEPLFSSEPFVPRPIARSGKARRPSGRRPSWEPRHQQVLRSGPSGPSRLTTTTTARPGGPVSRSGAGTMVSRPSGYSASTSYASTPTRMVSRGPQYAARQNLAPTSMQYRGAPAQMTAKGFKGLGQLVDSVSTRWKYAALGLGALVVAQFFWWDARAPQVLRGGGY